MKLAKNFQSSKKNHPATQVKSKKHDNANPDFFTAD